MEEKNLWRGVRLWKLSDGNGRTFVTENPFREG